MRTLKENFEIWFTALRGYSLPISIMSWLVPFLYALFNKGNVIYGIIALIGICILHLGTNIFDDLIDYIRAKKAIKNGLATDFNFQKGKCCTIFNKQLTVKDFFFASIILFSIALFIGLFFFFIYGTKLLYIVIPSAILCLLYPILGCLGFGEVIIAIIFSPLLYLGVYFVMTGTFSTNVLLLSISTGLLSIAVLHNHMLLDFEVDTKSRKITLCRLCKTPINALYLLGIIVFGAYLNIFLCIIFKLLSPVYIITFLSIPTAIILYKVMDKHIKNPNAEVKKNIFMGSTKEIDNVPEEQRNFLLKFIIVRNLLSLFTLLICIAVAISEIF